MQQPNDGQTEAVLNSLDKLLPAKAPAGFQAAVLARINRLQKRRVIVLPKSTIWLAAASMLLLIGANLYTILNHNTHQERSLASQNNSVAAEYFAPPPSI